MSKHIFATPGIVCLPHLSPELEDVSGVWLWNIYWLSLFIVLGKIRIFSVPLKIVCVTEKSKDRSKEYRLFLQHASTFILNETCIDTALQSWHTKEYSKERHKIILLNYVTRA